MPLALVLGGCGNKATPEKDNQLKLPLEIQEEFGAQEEDQSSEINAENESENELLLRLQQLMSHFC